MSDRPIIFSAPMVRALLAGRKTQTRRLLNPQPETFMTAEGECKVEAVHVHGETVPRIATGLCLTAQKLRYAVGDRLYVRETWKPHSTFAGMKPRDIPKSTVFYAADDRYAPSNTPWIPCIHMPRWASRLTLMVEAVKVERLNEISEADAIAEGVRPIQFSEGPNFFTVSMDGGSHNAPTAVETFQMLWECLHGIGRWAENPFVVAVTFSVLRGNIDQLRAEAA
jgi:hypothetical protein